MPKSYNIDKLTREEIFGGILIPPMRQLLKKESYGDTRLYDYNADIAIITHYLQNKGSIEEKMYAEEAKPLMERYFRATHTEYSDDSPVDIEKAEMLFSASQDGKAYQKFQSNNSFTFVDLFAGIGGFRIALEQLGGRCVYASEFNRMAQKSYGMNHGVIPFGDIKLQANKDRIPEDVDVLCAGFPCQPFSLAGLRRGFSDETKGTLFYDIKEIVEKKRPKVIILENVPGLLSIHNRDEQGNSLETKTIDTILQILRNDLKYHVPEPEVINAKHFGVPQNRDRVFIVGFRDFDDTEYAYPKSNGKDMRFGEIREKGIVDTAYYMSQRYWQTLVDHKVVQKDKGRGYGYCTVRDDEYGHTLMVGGMGLERNLIKDAANTKVNKVNDPRGELNHEHIRILTERECARMQGFPDYYDICVGRSSAYNQFGNSVAIPVVKEIARTLLEYAKIDHADII